jgi:hypothetical protein
MIISLAIGLPIGIIMIIIGMIVLKMNIKIKSNKNS